MTMSHPLSALSRKGLPRGERIAGMEKRQAERYVAPRIMPTAHGGVPSAAHRGPQQRGGERCVSRGSARSEQCDDWFHMVVQPRSRHSHRQSLSEKVRFRISCPGMWNLIPKTMLMTPAARRHTSRKPHTARRLRMDMAWARARGTSMGWGGGDSDEVTVRSDRGYGMERGRAGGRTPGRSW